MHTFYAIKKDQTHVYDKNGKRLFITRLVANPLVFTLLKTQEKDGYQSIQVGLGSKKRITKAIAGHTQKADITPQFLREILTKDSDNNDLKIGDKIEASQVFAIGDIIEIQAKGKGKGFAGGMKRHGFHGGPRTHGQSDRQRSPGSIGQGTDPGRVWKGKRMAGRMGGKNVTQRGSQLVYLSQEEIWLTGSVPGHRNSLVRLTKVDHQDFIGLQEK